MNDGQISHPIEQFFEYAPDAVIVANENQLIVEWNKKAITTFGFEKKEAIGMPIDQLIIPHRYREAHKRGMAHFLKTGEGPVLNKSIEITALHKQGYGFPVRLNISNVKVGNEWLFVAFMSDITERKAQEEKLNAQHEALKEIANIQSHEIRGPVANIMGLINLMKENDYQITRTELLLMESAVHQLDERIRHIVKQTYI